MFHCPLIYINLSIPCQTSCPSFALPMKFIWNPSLERDDRWGNTFNIYKITIITTRLNIQLHSIRILHQLVIWLNQLARFMPLTTMLAAGGGIKCHLTRLKDIRYFETLIGYTQASVLIDSHRPKTLLICQNPMIWSTTDEQTTQLILHRGPCGSCRLSVPMDVPLKVAWSGKARYTPNHTASKHLVIIPCEVGGRTDLVQILYAKKLIFHFYYIILSNQSLGHFLPARFYLLLYQSKQTL